MAVHTVWDVATISIRASDSDVEEIDRRARGVGMTRTAFMLRAALDSATADEQRFEKLEDRVVRLEQARYGESY